MRRLYSFSFYSIARKAISVSLAISLSLSLGLSPTMAQNLTIPAGFQPPVLKGLAIHAENPLLFDFIVDRGQEDISAEILKKESTKLVEFFLTSLAIPDKQAWVNLSPYEKDRIIPDSLGSTEMGKVMLEQDYLLKQLTASLTNPDTELGKKYWDEIHRRSKNQNPSVMNKVWITPDSASVAEKDGFAYITESRLNVMIDEDYQAVSDSRLADSKEKTSTEVFREMILPVLEREVNEGKNFASTRQIYQSVILAAWYKLALKESLLGKIYVDRAKLTGIEVNDKEFKAKVYEQYLQIFQKGVYNVVKEQEDENGEMIARKYFSGGQTFGNVSEHIKIVRGSSAIAALSADAARLGPRVNSAIYRFAEFGESRPTNVADTAILSRAIVDQGSTSASSSLAERITGVAEAVFARQVQPQMSKVYPNQPDLVIATRVLFVKMMLASKKRNLTRADITRLLEPNNFESILLAVKLKEGPEAQEFNKLKTATSRAIFIAKNILSYAVSRDTVRDVEFLNPGWLSEEFLQQMRIISSSAKLALGELKTIHKAFPALDQPFEGDQFSVLGEAGEKIVFSVEPSAGRSQAVIRVKTEGPALTKIDEVFELGRDLHVIADPFKAARGEVNLVLASSEEVNLRTPLNVDFVIQVNKTTSVSGYSGTASYAFSLFNFADVPVSVSVASSAIDKETVAREMFERWLVQGKFARLAQYSQDSEIIKVSKALFVALMQYYKPNVNGFDIRRIIDEQRLESLLNGLALNSSLEGENENFAQKSDLWRAIYIMTTFLGYEHLREEGRYQNPRARKDFSDELKSLQVRSVKKRKVAKKEFVAERSVDLKAGHSVRSAEINNTPVIVYIADDYQLRLTPGILDLEVEVLGSGENLARLVKTKWLLPFTRTVRISSVEVYNSDVSQVILSLKPGSQWTEPVDFKVKFIPQGQEWTKDVDAKPSAFWFTIQNKGNPITVDYFQKTASSALTAFDIAKSLTMIQREEMARKIFDQIYADPEQLKELKDALQGEDVYIRNNFIALTGLLFQKLLASTRRNPTVGEVGRILDSNRAFVRDLMIYSRFSLGQDERTGKSYNELDAVDRAIFLMTHFLGFQAQVQSKGKIRFVNVKAYQIMDEALLASEKTADRASSQIADKRFVARQLFHDWYFKENRFLTLESADEFNPGLFEIARDLFVELLIDPVTQQKKANIINNIKLANIQKDLAQLSLISLEENQDQEFNGLDVYGKARFIMVHFLNYEKRAGVNGYLMNRDERKLEFEKRYANWSEEQKKSGASSAVDVGGRVSPVGGIDFDASKINLQIKRDGQGVPLPLPQQDWEHIDIKGLYPVMINIQPINLNTLPIFSFNQADGVGKKTSS